jgi:hypothetical protein
MSRVITAEEFKSHNTWLETNGERGSRLDLTRRDLAGADLSRATLRGANLRGADLTGADLSRATLRGANLRGADLTGADLTGADLSGADLTDADLTDADLTGANLRGADLTDANLSESNLSGANLSESNLSGANLSGANLEPIKSDLFSVFSAEPESVPCLLAELRAGRIDGRYYDRTCSCLLGTIAKSQKVEYTRLKVRPNSSRAAERWFLAITEGLTPATSPVAAITEQWLVEWIDTH